MQFQKVQNQQQHQLQDAQYPQYHLTDQNNQYNYPATNQNIQIPNQNYPNPVPIPIQNDNQNQGNKSSMVYQSEGTLLQLNDRLPFIKKVYGIVLTQLLFTIILCIIAYTVEEFRVFQVKYYFIVIIALVVSFVIEIILMCYPKQANKVPNNYILLGIFTIFMGYIVSQICSTVFYFYGESGGLVYIQIKASIVLLSAILCLVMTVGLTVYAFKTKTDFTSKGYQYLYISGAALWMFSIGVMGFGILLIFFYSRILNLIYSFIICILFGLYLIYDTQLIMGGKSHQFSIDDYIIAALLIYIDIVILFITIISLLTQINNN